MGGLDHTGRNSHFDGRVTRLVEIFDTRTNTWSTGVPMPMDIDEMSSDGSSDEDSGDDDGSSDEDSGGDDSRVEQN